MHSEKVKFEKERNDAKPAMIPLILSRQSDCPPQDDRFHRPIVYRLAGHLRPEILAEIVDDSLVSDEMQKEVLAKSQFPNDACKTCFVEENKTKNQHMCNRVKIAGSMNFFLNFCTGFFMAKVVPFIELYLYISN